MTDVLLDVRRATWYPEVGISRYARGLMRAIVDADPPDVRVAALDLRGSPHWSGTRTVHVGRRHGFVARAVDEQLRMARLSRRTDVLHLPWYEGPVKPACRFVVTIHDLDTVVNPERYPWRFRAYYNSLLRAHVRLADRIIVPSLASLEALEARWPGRPYEHVYYGIDAVFGPRDGAPTPDAEDRFVLYTGGWGQRKRIDVLLAAFERVVATHPTASLVVTGNPGPEDRRRIAAAGTDRIVLCGRVSDEALADLYRRAAVMVYPSAMEGFGFPVLEAFACGTPVVALASGSVPEIAGGAALLVDRDDAGDVAEAVLSVLGDQRLAADLRARGKVRAADFTWAETARRTLDVYRELGSG